MKKMGKVVAIVLCVALFVCILGGCGSSSISGDYYAYVDGEKVDDSCISFSKNGTWELDGEEGTYVIEDGTITLYYDMLGSEVELLSGTYANGVISYDIYGMEFTLEK